MKEQHSTLFLVQEAFSDGCTFNNEVSLAGFTKEASAAAVCADMMKRTNNNRDFHVRTLTVYAFGDPAAIAKTLLRDNPK